MQLTIFTDYGLRCLMYLATHPEKRCTVAEISEQYQISRNHLVKVVQRLVQLGYVISSKGKGGGLELAYPSKDMRLGDTVQQLEPDMHLVECFNRAKNACKITPACQVKYYLQEATQSFIATLNQYTLADSVSGNILFPAKNR